MGWAGMMDLRKTPEVGECTRGPRGHLNVSISRDANGGGSLADWLLGWLAYWLAVCLSVCLSGWLAGWLADRPGSPRKPPASSPQC